MQTNIESFLPHSGEMVLIDEIVEVGADFITTKMFVKNHQVFCEILQDSNADSTKWLVFPTHKSIELMAQSLGIFRSFNKQGAKNRLGFLLGARKFKILMPFIRDEATIKATLSMQDSSGFSIWDCEIYESDILLCSANLSVLNPNDDFIDNLKGKK